MSHRILSILCATVLLWEPTETLGSLGWSGAAAGGTERFGRSYKAENYYETLSDAVLRATQNLLANSAFTKAFSHL